LTGEFLKSQGYGAGAGAPVVGVQCRAASLTSWALVIAIIAGDLSSSGGL